MTRVRILGRRQDAERVLGELYRIGLVEMADGRAAPELEALGDEVGRSGRDRELQDLVASADRLLAGLPAAVRPAAGPHGEVQPDIGGLRSELARLTPLVEDANRRLDSLRDESLVLAGYLEPLRLLLPLAPELADLDVDDLVRLRLATAVLVLNTTDEELVEALRTELVEELGARFELVWTRVEEGVMGCFVVFPYEDQAAVHALVRRVQVRSVALPERFEGLSLLGVVAGMQGRLTEIPGLVADAEAERRSLLLPNAARIGEMRSAAAAELERLRALEQLGATERTFLAECWVPRSQLGTLRRDLAKGAESPVFVEDLATSPRDQRAPVLMRNPRSVRPFEALVRFLELPSAGSLDPTLLMALFLPLMFGMMVGDVGYGVVLLAVALLARRSRAAASPEVAAVIRVLLMGAVCSVAFGFLFGEFFGDLGMRLIGDWALWQYRPSAGALESLLLFAVVVGAAHVVLGLVLGAWQSFRFGAHRLLLDKLGMLLALGGIFGVAGRIAGRLPAGALVPSIAALVVGLVLIMSLHGALGVATGPLDLLGRLGNILSYLRLAAVGLASAHLAGVANELGTVGPIWLGVLVAAFFHALNLALASFSPMIQSLRLHYVEFFGTFLVGGGRAFKRFGPDPEREVPATT